MLLWSSSSAPSVGPTHSRGSHEAAVDGRATRSATSCGGGAAEAGSKLSSAASGSSTGSVEEKRRNMATALETTCPKAVAWAAGGLLAPRGAKQLPLGPPLRQLRPAMQKLQQLNISSASSFGKAAGSIEISAHGRGKRSRRSPASATSSSRQARATEQLLSFSLETSMAGRIPATGSGRELGGHGVVVRHVASCGDWLQVSGELGGNGTAVAVRPRVDR